jgi:hypothetical protein
VQVERGGDQAVAHDGLHTLAAFADRPRPPGSRILDTWPTGDMLLAAHRRIALIT